MLPGCPSLLPHMLPAGWLWSVHISWASNGWDLNFEAHEQSLATGTILTM